MRKTLAILALSAVTLIGSAGDVFAQRGLLGGFGRGIGLSIGNGGYYGGNYGGNYYNRGYSPYSYGGNYLGNRYGYGSYNSLPYSYGSSYNTAPYYSGSQYYSSPTFQIPANSIQQSFYDAPAISQQAAAVMVVVPRADAQVWFDGALTSQQGMERMFHSPPLESGTYTYTVRAKWTENGQTVDRERRINVRPGQSVTVDFRTT